MLRWNGNAWLSKTSRLFLRNGVLVTNVNKAFVPFCTLILRSTFFAMTRNLNLHSAINLLDEEYDDDLVGDLYQEDESDIDEDAEMPEHETDTDEVP